MLRCVPAILMEESVIKIIFCIVISVDLHLCGGVSGKLRYTIVFDWVSWAGLLSIVEINHCSYPVKLVINITIISRFSLYYPCLPCLRLVQNLVLRYWVVLTYFCCNCFLPLVALLSSLYTPAISDRSYVHGPKLTLYLYPKPRLVHIFTILVLIVLITFLCSIYIQLSASSIRLFSISLPSTKHSLHRNYTNTWGAHASLETS